MLGKLQGRRGLCVCACSVMCVACCGVVFVRMGVVCSLACDGLCVGTCFACGCGSARAAGGMRAHLGGRPRSLVCVEVNSDGQKLY